MDVSLWFQLVNQFSGLMHDFGKMISCFQKSLRGENENEYDPVRHERMSVQGMIMLCIHVKDPVVDEASLFKALGSLSADDFKQCFQDGFDFEPSQLPHVTPSKVLDKPFLEETADFIYAEYAGTFKTLAVINHLILSHHFIAYSEDDKMSEHRYVKACNGEMLAGKLSLYGKPVWDYPEWLNLFTSITRQLSTVPPPPVTLAALLNIANIILRPTLVAADQRVSSEDNFELYTNSDVGNVNFANTYKGVDGRSGLAVPLHLHTMRVVERVQEYTQLTMNIWNDQHLDFAHLPPRLNVNDVRDEFRWQITAQCISDDIRAAAAPRDGYFGVVIAETGSGKTQANARIMAFLQGQNHIRFTLALGLRTLTEQSGLAFINEIGFQINAEVSVLIGGQFQSLTETNQAEDTQQNLDEANKIASKIIGGDHIDDQSTYPTQLAGPQSVDKRYKSNAKTLSKMGQVPILVCTVDHLMTGLTSQKSSEAKRLLRLATADLVLDEIDSFSQEDIEGLARLIYYTGLSGRRVLLSSATIPPALGSKLFLAYQLGYEQYASMQHLSGVIHTAWYTNYSNVSGYHALSPAANIYERYEALYNTYCEKLIAELCNRPVRRKAGFIAIEGDKESLFKNSSKAISSAIDQLHQAYPVKKDIVSLSVGLIRLSNTKHAMSLFRELVDEDTESVRLYVFYQAKLQTPILNRIETMLNRLLKRKHERGEDDPIWCQPEIIAIRKKHPNATNIQIIVVSTPIEEVGRDHDFDWVILEPTSYWSLIQTVGRLWRHRLWKLLDGHPNVLILSQNFNAILKRFNPYSRPGPEDHDHHLISGREASSLFAPEITEVIDSRYCLRHNVSNEDNHKGKNKRSKYYKNFSEIEIGRIKDSLSPITEIELLNPIMAVSNLYTVKHPFRDDAGVIDIELRIDDFYRYRYKRHDWKLLSDSLVETQCNIDSKSENLLLNYGEGYQHNETVEMSIPCYRNEPRFEIGNKYSDYLYCSAVMGVQIVKV